MKKFNFRLEQVLKIRILEERIQQKEFARIKNQHLLAVKIMADIYSDRKLTVDSLTKHEKRDFNQTIYLSHMRYIEKLNLDVDIQRINISKIEIELKKERNKLLEIMKKRKSLENLKEKKYQEYVYENHLEEQKIMDDIAGSRFLLQ